MFTWKLIKLRMTAYFCAMRKTALTLATSVALLAACGGCGTDDQGKAPRSKAPGGQVEDEQDARDGYYKPYEVFNSINGVGGKQVADIDAGDGYFTWRLLNAGADVIAVCRTQEEADNLKAEQEKRKIPDSRLTISIAPDLTQTGLGINKMDMIVMGGSMVGIPDPGAYGEMLLGNLKSDGFLLLFEWKPIDSPVGPPVDQRYQEMQMMDILQSVGYTDVGSQSKLLPYHYVIVAQRFQGEGVVPPGAPS